MGQILVRNIDDALKAQLKERAASEGVSMEETVRMILREALQPRQEKGLGTRIAELFSNIEGNDEPLERLPTKPWRPMTFDE